MQRKTGDEDLANMCADELNIGLILPNIAAFSGGMERSLRQIENSTEVHAAIPGGDGVPEAGHPLEGGQRGGRGLERRPGGWRQVRREEARDGRRRSPEIPPRPSS